MPDETLELVERLAQGDRAALDLLIERNLAELHGFIRLNTGRLITSQESSEDLVQSVCRELLQNMDVFQYPHEKAFKNWLYKTALRKIRKRHAFYRAAKRDPANEVGAIGGGEREQNDLAACYATVCTPSRIAGAREQVELLEAAFERLPEDYRRVITLARVVGLSRAEIGEEMGRSEGAVRVLLMRAQAQLADVYDKMC